MHESYCLRRLGRAPASQPDPTVTKASSASHGRELRRLIGLCMAAGRVTTLAGRATARPAIGRAAATVRPACTAAADAVTVTVSVDVLTLTTRVAPGRATPRSVCTDTDGTSPLGVRSLTNSMYGPGGSTSGPGIATVS